MLYRCFINHINNFKFFVLCRGAFRFFQVNLLLWWWEKREYTVAKVFSKYAAAHPNKIAYIFEDKEWTYEQVISDA